MATGRSTSETNFANKPSLVLVQASTRRDTIGSGETGGMLLATLAALTFTYARWEWAPSASLAILQCAPSLLLAWSCWLALRREDSFSLTLDRLLPAVFLAAIAFPPMLEALARIFGQGDALELMMLAGLQNAALVAGAFSHRPRCRQVAALFSGFLVLYSLSLSESRGLLAMAGLFGGLLLWWMMVRYWERVQATHAASRAERCLPVRSGVLAAVAVVALLLIAILGTRKATTYAVKGFLPTSGGDAWSDPTARAGVGDGDAMVAAQEQAMSFGPVESDLFLDSQLPTLYDLFNDTYGEPPGKKQKQQRSVALSASEVKSQQGKVARSQRNGREFSTVRKQTDSGKRNRELQNRDSPALLYVIGRTPLHLALEYYDVFDGREWTRATNDVSMPPLRIEQSRGEPWVQWKRRRDSTLYGELEPHALKFINLKTNRVPSPPHLAAAHIDKVDKVDFFGWTSDGMLAMPVRKEIPPYTVVRLRSHTVNYETLRKRIDLPTRRAESETSTPLYQSESAAELATQWTAGLSHGWRQVETVVQHLRQEFLHDPEARAPEDCSDVVAHFLQVKRGPDYLFATTAAAMIRSLGHPTRLVAGLYARTENFNRRSGQTTVGAEDLHTWAEVCLDGDWIPIEPTPGFVPPLEHLTWRQRLALFNKKSISWLARHAVLLVGGAATLLLLWFTRCVWGDGIAAAACWLLGKGSIALQVRSTVRLLEWRAWLAGLPRPPGATIRRWYSAPAGVLNIETQSAINRFFDQAEIALYASELPATSDSIPELCRLAARVVSRESLRKWKQEN